MQFSKLFSQAKKTVLAGVGALGITTGAHACPPPIFHHHCHPHPIVRPCFPHYHHCCPPCRPFIPCRPCLSPPPPTAIVPTPLGPVAVRTPFIPPVRPLLPPPPPPAPVVVPTVVPGYSPVITTPSVITTPVVTTPVTTIVL